VKKIINVKYAIRNLEHYPTFNNTKKFIKIKAVDQFLLAQLQVATKPISTDAV